MENIFIVRSDISTRKNLDEAEKRPRKSSNIISNRSAILQELSHPCYTELNKLKLIMFNFIYITLELTEIHHRVEIRCFKSSLALFISCSKPAERQRFSSIAII